MKEYEIHFYTKNVGDGTHLDCVHLPETPQIGSTLIINQITKCRSRSRGIGIVEKLVMSENSPSITIFVRESIQ